MASGAAGSAVGSADVEPNPLEITARLLLGIKDVLSSDRSTEKVQRLMDDLTNNLKTTGEEILQPVHLDDGRVLGAADLVKDMVAKRGVMAAAEAMVRGRLEESRHGGCALVDEGDAQYLQPTPPDFGDSEAPPAESSEDDQPETDRKRARYHYYENSAAADPAELYKLLGVTTDASTADIKKAFRSMALLWHPDKKPQNPEATSRFQKISEAYSVLVDANKRHVYDLTEWSRDSEEDEV